MHTAQQYREAINSLSKKDKKYLLGAMTDEASLHGILIRSCAKNQPIRIELSGGQVIAMSSMQDIRILCEELKIPPPIEQLSLFSSQKTATTLLPA